MNADITERKMAELAVARANERLLESDQRKDEYLAMLGHELRNPLAAICNAAQVMKHVAVGDQRIQRALGVLERQSVHMSRLIEGLLEITRITRGKIRLDRMTFDTREIVDAVFQDRLSDARIAGLELIRELPADPVWIHADRVRVAQVVDNLVGNAIKFTTNGGTICITVQQDDSHAEILVRDTGVGIRAEMLQNLFEPFTQENQELARTAGGLGLGLAVAKGLVDLHGGTIEAHSAGLGAGADLRVRLPIAAAPTRGHRRHENGIIARRILIVEDNPDAGESLRDLLELDGHHVTIVGTGPMALEALSRQDTDVVLCDLGLPGMSGFDVVQAIRSDPRLKNMPVVALSGYGQPEDRMKTKKVGFDAHLVKPIDIIQLNDLLNEL